MVDPIMLYQINLDCMSSTISRIHPIPSYSDHPTISYHVISIAHPIPIPNSTLLTTAQSLRSSGSDSDFVIGVLVLVKVWVVGVIVEQKPK